VIFYCTIYKIIIFKKYEYNQELSGFPWSILLSYLNKAPASTILLNSMQKACKSINISLGLIILFLIMLFINTQTRRTSRFYKFLSFLLSSQQTMQLEMYKVRNSLGSSTALANLLINSKEQSDNSIFTSFSKYLKLRGKSITEKFRGISEDLLIYWRRFGGFAPPTRGKFGEKLCSYTPIADHFRRPLEDLWFPGHSVEFGALFKSFL